MSNNQHSILSKLHCRMMAFIGLCLAMLFVVITNNYNTFAETTNLDIQYNYLGAMDNNKYDLNTGFPSANIVNTSINMNDVEDYYSLVLSAIQIGLGQLDRYFDFTVNITNFNYQTWYSCLQSYSFITGEINPSDRGEWLNAYIGIDSSNNGYVFLQYCPRVDSIESYPVYDANIFNGCIYYPLVVNDSQVTFTFYHGANFGGNKQGLMISSGLVGNNQATSDRLYVTDYQYTGSWIPALWGAFDYYQDYPTFSTLSVSNYNILNYKHRFFYPKDTNSLYYVSDGDGVSFKYLLPLYVDSTIYLFDNNKIETSLGNLLYGTTTGGYQNYTYNNLTLEQPGIFNSINYVGFIPTNLPRIEKGYGIVNNPFYTPTPIPTFQPIYTPTPVPTYFIPVTITPITLPVNPIIDTSYGDPISYVMAMINMVGSVLSSNVVTFFSTVVSYIYNSSIFFEILMFVIPAIILIAFVVGRLKKK